MMTAVGRFAPSTTGEPHPGTLLAALLAWLDAKAADGRIILRLEDLDPQRCTPTWASTMIEATAWLGLSWDEVVVQSARHADHGEALDRLAAMGRLYPCECTRADRRGGVRAPDGGWAYDNRCRHRPLPAAGWRTSEVPLRVRLDDGLVEVRDESGADLSQRVTDVMGDPVVRRRDGAVAYQLAVVVDDAASGVTRVVRGQDIAASTATQVALARLLQLPRPVYRHHFLLLEENTRGEKLSKLHGSVGISQLRAKRSGAEVCGYLAYLAGLTVSDAAVSPAVLLSGFSWDLIRVENVVDRMAW